MVCQTCPEAAQVPAVLRLSENSFRDNGRNRERMQRSSLAKPQNVQGNKYTPFPSLAPSSSSAGCSIASPVPRSDGPTAGIFTEGAWQSSESAHLPMHVQCGHIQRFLSSGRLGHGVQRDVTAHSRPNGHTQVREPRENGRLFAELQLTPPPPPSYHNTPTFSTKSDAPDGCKLVSWPLVPDSEPSPPSPSPPPRSNTFLYFYKNLPKVSSDTDYDRLERSMRGLFEGCFYYQDMDNSTARSMLAHAPEGTFLVRDSSDPKYLFSITVKTAKGASSVRVLYYRGCFQLDCDDRMKKKLPRFETLMDLLDFHVTVSRDPRGGQYRWQENSRNTDMVINLTTPRRHSPPTLSHLARVSVNRTLQDLHLPNRSTDLLPVHATLKHFLRAYPFKI